MTGVEGWEVEGRRGLSAGKGEIVLAVKLHLPHHLRLQTPVQMTAVLQALPPPSLGAVAVFTHPKPVSRTPGGEDTLCLVKAYTFFDVVVVCQKWIRFILAQELNNESGWNTGHYFKKSRKQHFYIITSKMLFLYFYLCLMCASLNPALRAWMKYTVLFPYIIYSPLLAEKKQMLPHIPRVDDTIWVFVYYISVR